MTENNFIEVLNYNNNSVAVEGVDPQKGHLFTPAQDGEPTMIPMTMTEIKYINSHCDAFRNGTLRFRADEEDKIYETLGIKKSDILFQEVIDDAIRHPNAEKLNKLIAIKSVSVFERVRGAYYSMVNAGEDLSVKVGRLIDLRYKELRAGKLHTELVVTENDGTATSKQNAEMDELRKQIAEQNKQLNEYKELFEKMLAQMGGTAALSAENVDNNTEKPRGRKKKVAIVTEE